MEQTNNPNGQSETPTIPVVEGPISTGSTPVIEAIDPPEANAEDQSAVVVGGAKDPRKEGFKSIITTIVILVAAPLVALFLITFVFQSYQVDGPSMETTFQNEDRLIVSKIPRTLARVSGHPYIPHRGDVIIFIARSLLESNGVDPKQLIKRVIGLPGDRVVVADGFLTIYNTEHPRGYRPDENARWSDAIKTTSGNIDEVVEEGKVFVNGDNRENSLDSRYFGQVPAGDIVGKLVFRIFPINKAESY